MTVVAAAISPDFAVVAADCRITVLRGVGTHPIVTDNAQKILRLGEHSVIAFAGDLSAATFLLCHVLGPQLRSRRHDGASVRHWLPRYLRAIYQRHRAILQRLGPCSFLVASTTRRNARVAIEDVIRRPRESDLQVQNWLALRIGADLDQPSGVAEVPDSSAGFLYRVDSPEFEPRDCRTLSCTAMGSGAAHVMRALNRYEALIVLDSPDLGVGWFVEAVAQSFGEMGVETCGGLFLVAMLSRGEVSVMLHARSSGAGRVALIKEAGRFVQVEHSTGARITLRPPWEIAPIVPTRSLPFPPYSDYWEDPGTLGVRRYPEFVTRERQLLIDRDPNRRDD